MAWSTSILQRGVCGNFRFKIYDLTDAQNTNSVVKTDMDRIDFISSTNTTDNADNLKAQTLSWTGTCDADTANQLEDSSETFVNELNGIQVFATSGANDGDSAFVEFQSGDTDNLLLTDPSDGSDEDLFPAGTETYSITHEGYVLVDPVTNADEGTLFIIGD